MSDRQWDSQEATRLYQVAGWGGGLFSINGQGNVEALIDGNRPLDLKKLCDRLEARGIRPPLLLRFSDMLRWRMEQLHQRFSIACMEADYRGRYYGVYPIKVNQQRQVVEEVVEFGRKFHWGLEAGSKPELHAVLAMLGKLQGPVVCNGYKDREFVELAMIGRRMGQQIFVVVEKPEELNLIIDVARRLRVDPLIGLRCRLAATSNGLWDDSGGDGSKFGLSAAEMLEGISKLKDAQMLGCLKLLHFHIGSQIPQIRRIREAVQEASRYFLEVRRLGAPVTFVDVGGGLGVNYEGNIAGSPTSVDYTLQEYANDIIWTMKRVCDEESQPHPHIISESGRALVAHHAVLVIDVLSVSRRFREEPPLKPGNDAPAQLQELWETLRDLGQIHPREALHDATAYRDDMIKLFNLGHTSLSSRAHADDLYWQLVSRLKHTVDGERMEQFVPGLLARSADRYFCNFSVFQSLPDVWALRQLFPVMPLHRLNEKPTRQGVLVDITCDSDGIIDSFPLEGGRSPTLPLHPKIEGEPYYIGIFLAGAYQEILGDMHNLFGDTHLVNLRVDDEGQIQEQVLVGKTVAEVLDSVEFPKSTLIERMRRQLQNACAGGKLSDGEASGFLDRYQEGLRGYTYLKGRPRA